MKTKTPTDCKPIDCDVCETKHQSPICSIENALEEIKQSRITSRFKSGQIIFYQGNDPMGLYTIQSGLIKLESVSNDGSAHTLRLMGPGQAVGYRSLFAGGTYQASAVAVEDGQICFIPKTVLFSVIEKNPKAALNLLGQLSKDLRTAEEKWITQIDKDASERVAEALLFLNDHFKDQQWTRREIAEWAGTTPETVMRTLSQFEKEGWIQPKGRLYLILQPEKLLEKASGT